VGDYPELFSVAMGSILGAEGLYLGGIGADIEVLEEDNYRRVLFTYIVESDVYPTRYIIMQKCDGEYAYFYPHYNFISSMSRGVSDEALDMLKEANSWNREMSDAGEFDRVRITRSKDTGPISDKKRIDVYLKIFPSTNMPRWRSSSAPMVFLRTDTYGRSIYYTGGRIDGFDVGITVFFSADHSFDIETGMLDVTGLIDYQTELRLFMDANGWNTPP